MNITYELWTALDMALRCKGERCINSAGYINPVLLGHSPVIVVKSIYP